MSLIEQMCKMPGEVRDAVCDLNIEHIKVWNSGMDEDGYQAVMRNDEEEIEGWCQDMISRLGLDEDTVYYFQDVMMRWRDE